ncbi:hypothetical protein ABZ851_25125 [Streptomyces sp. NPDC047049]|uniref:hypothetical protein n=1 Tax=Streptomyces sp. NPDC047049 TaxID=3156688 RepID=UPI0033D11503
MPVPGSFAVDGRDGRVGVVVGLTVGHEEAFVQLRPPGGGVLWVCPRHALRAAPPSAVLAARVRELNWQSRMP